MVSFQNVGLVDSGKPVIDDRTKEPLDFIGVMRIVLDHTQYENRGDLRAADKVYKKLEDLPKETEGFELEDAEGQLLKRHAMAYRPLLVGRIFLPVLDELDRAVQE